MTMIAEVEGNRVILSRGSSTQIYHTGDEVTKLATGNGIYVGRRDGIVERLEDGQLIRNEALEGMEVSALHIGSFVWVGYNTGFGVKYDLETGEFIEGKNIALDNFRDEHGRRRDDFYTCFFEKDNRLYGGTRMGKFRSAPIEDIRTRAKWENHIRRSPQAIERIIEHEGKLYFTGGHVCSFDGDIKVYEQGNPDVKDIAFINGAFYATNGNQIFSEYGKIDFPAERLERMAGQLLALDKKGLGVIIDKDKITREKKYRGKIFVFGDRKIELSTWQQLKSLARACGIF